MNVKKFVLIVYMLEGLNLPNSLFLDTLDNIKRVKYLGDGSYGEVWLVEDMRDQQQYALKYFLKNEFLSNKKRLVLLEKEIVHLAAVSGNPYICGIDSIGEDSKYLLILQEFCGESLSKRMRDASREQKVQWFIDMCHGVKHCHERDIIHLDIKPENVVISDNAKLIDFGVSQYAKNVDLSVVGTMDYMAPEAGDDDPKIGFYTDIWALGVSFYQMLYGILPFEAEGNRSFRLYLENLEQGKWNRDRVEPQLIPLFEGVFQLDINRRWNIRQLLDYISK